MPLFKRLFIHSPGRYIAALLIAIAVGTFLLGTTSFDLLYNWGNAVTLAGAVLIFFGLLVLVSFYGAFSTFAYAFSTFNRKGRKYEDLVDYNNKQLEKRKKSNLIYMPYIAVGVILLIVGLILFALI